MWRLRGMRDAVQQLSKWNEVYEVALVPKDYVTRIERAAAECAEAIRLIQGDAYRVAIPAWGFVAEPNKKKNGAAKRAR